jgi:hypothetical protein
MLIKISSDVVIQFNMYTKESCLENLNEDECVLCFKDDLSSHETGAKILVDAFADRWTPLFIISLIKKLNNRLIEDYKTKFSFNIKDQDEKS